MFPIREMSPSFLTLTDLISDDGDRHANSPYI